MVHDGRDALVVDPGDEGPVIEALDRHGLTLRSILVTHHHADHVGGLNGLRDRLQGQVLGPAMEDIPGPFQPLTGGDEVQALGLRFQVIDVPGHTAGHIAFYSDNLGGTPVLFCGDTLFSGGCGRLFEGTAAQMHASLGQLAALPAATRVCCAHEYTLSNLKFALAVEPGNPALIAHMGLCTRLREQGLPTLPVALHTERAINPFLRSREPTVCSAVRLHNPQAVDEVSTFAVLRQWKNDFR